jgi:hypothetical protein
MNDPRKISRWSTPLVCAGALVCLGIGFAAARWTALGPAAPRGEGASAAAPMSVGEKNAGMEASVSLSWEDRWQEKKGRPACPATTRARAALIEELARTDPQRALKLALAESNWLIRDQLRAAALRGWAAVAPDAASEWAMAQTIMGERMRCVSAVLAGAVEHPEEAVRVALKACAADPRPAGDYGHNLINALVDRTGDFKIAAEFARAADMVDRQSYLIDSAYYQWAQHEPERAFAELAAVTDPGARDAAIKGVIEGCADSDARKLADYAKVLPEGDDRSRILAVALPEWVGKDPEAALKWINDAGPSQDFDLGLAALARLPSMMESRPAMAMELTDNITDPVRRSLTKSDVFVNWARHDYEAAERYAQSVQNPEYQEMFRTDLRTVAAGRNP